MSKWHWNVDTLLNFRRPSWPYEISKNFLTSPFEHTVVQMCTLMYTTFTHFAVSQSVLQNRLTELRPSEITLMNRVDQLQGFKLSLNDRQTDRKSKCRSPSALWTVWLENIIISPVCLERTDASFLIVLVFSNIQGGGLSILNWLEH
jgi:hypothetical protein